MVVGGDGHVGASLSGGTRRAAADPAIKTDIAPSTACCAIRQFSHGTRPSFPKQRTVEFF
jgi:hypothetical protein